MPMSDDLQLWFTAALLASGWENNVRLSIGSGKITHIAVDVQPSAGDERHGIAIVGLPNVHSHAFQRAMAGLTEFAGAQADNFWSWREWMYRFVDRLEPEGIEAIAAFAYLEMLEAGCTHVGEFHYLHHDCNGQPYATLGE